MDFFLQSLILGLKPNSRVQPQNILLNKKAGQKHKQAAICCTTSCAVGEWNTVLFFADFICFSNTGELMYRRTKNSHQELYNIYRTFFSVFMEN